MIATKRAEVTLETLGELAALANSKDIYGKPYAFYGPVYVVANAAERLRLRQLEPRPYVVQADTRKVYLSTGAGWALTEIDVLDTLPESRAGAAGELLVVGGVLRVWRPGSDDRRFAAGWYNGDVRGVIEALRLALLSRRSSWFPYQTYVKNDRYLFSYLGQETLSHVMPWRTESVQFRVSAEQERLYSWPELGNASYIASRAVRVDCVVPGTTNGYPQAYSAGGPSSGDRFRVIYKFRLKHAGQHSGRLTGSFIVFGFGRTPAQSGEPTWTVTGPTVSYTQTVVRKSDTRGNVAFELHVAIDSAWSGEEQTFDISVSIPWTQEPFQTFQQLQGTALFASFTISGAMGSPSENTICGEGFESFANGMPDVTSESEAVREGPVFQEGWAGVGANAAAEEARLLFEDGWRNTTNLSSVAASENVAGGVWRAIPLAMMNGVETDPVVFLDRNRSYFAPERDEPVVSEDGTVSVVTAVDGVIPRYPVLRTTDVPNRRSIRVETRVGHATFPGGGTIYCVSVHRVREGAVGLSVRVGWIDESGTFRAKATLAIAAGTRDSERIYPGWVVMNGITMAYECSEPVNVQALWIGTQRYGNPGDPLGGFLILPDANTAGLKGEAVLMAEVFNDVEAVLNALP